MKFDREFGWGMLTLVCLVEFTGIERFRKECDRIADFSELENYFAEQSGRKDDESAELRLESDADAVTIHVADDGGLNTLELATVLDIARASILNPDNGSIPS